MTQIDISKCTTDEDQKLHLEKEAHGQLLDGEVR